MKKLLVLLALLFVMGCTTFVPAPDKAAIEVRVVETVKTMKTDIAQAVECTLTAALSPTPTIEWTPTIKWATPLTATPRTTPHATAAALGRITTSSWLKETSRQVEIETNAMDTVTALLTYPMIEDAGWIGLIVTQVARYRQADALLRKIIPPGNCREAHEMLLSASSDGLRGMEYLVEGLQQNRPSLLEKAVQYMDSSANKMRISILMVEALGLRF